MKTQQEKKTAVAMAAIAHLPKNEIIGVGSGTTVHCFIDTLARTGFPLKGAVASSEETASRLRAAGITLYTLNETGDLPLYIDGADECDPQGRLIKGGGAALTREKIIASASERFICLLDDSKCVDLLGKFPLPIEVIDMARSYVARTLVCHGGAPEYRAGCLTDNGHTILDVYHLDFTDLAGLDSTLNNIAGVVSHGLFVSQSADLALIASEDGVRETPYKSRTTQ